MSRQVSDAAGDADADARSTVNRATAVLTKRARDGTLAIVAGSGLLAWAIGVRKRPVRAVVLGLPGVTLVGVGVRQWLETRREDRIVTGEDARRDESGQKQVSDEAFAERRDLGAGRTADESASVSQSATAPNPRGTTDREDVEGDEGGEGGGGGDVEFVEESRPESHRATHLEDDDAHDPRLHPEDEGEPTEVDLSTAAMADEVSEATGPHPEQAYPAREGTDPEPTSPKAPERVGQGAVAPADPEGESDGDDRTTEADENAGNGGDAGGDGNAARTADGERTSEREDESADDET